MKIYPWLLLVLLAWLQYRLWWGPNGLDEYWVLRARIAAQGRENGEFRRRNAALAGEVADLRDGLSALEERARAELGLVKPLETFYQVIE